MFAMLHFLLSIISNQNGVRDFRRKHLLSALICAVSNLEPDYELLSTDQQCQPTHKNIIDFDLIIIIKQEIFIKQFEYTNL